MRQISLIIVLSLYMAVQAQAAKSGGAVPFFNYSTPNAQTVYSPVYNVKGYKTKTVTTQCTNMSTLANIGMIGAVGVLCAPTVEGPWSICKNSRYSGEPNVSTNQNTTITWEDSNDYVKVSWTRILRSRVKVWLNWSE